MELLFKGSIALGSNDETLTLNATQAEPVLIFSMPY